MTFLADEQSVSASAPVELYTFTATGGIVYRLTSYDTDFTFASQLYTAVAISRTSTDITGSDEAQEMIITLPASSPLVKDNMFNVFPGKITATIVRVQQVSGLSQQVWSGFINSMTTEGRMAKLRVPSIMDDLLATAVPSVNYQQQCSHRLFDDGCTLSPVSYSIDTTLVSMTGKVVTVAPFGTFPDVFFQAGEMVHVASTEGRLVLLYSGVTVTL